MPAQNKPVSKSLKKCNSPKSDVFAVLKSESSQKDSRGLTVSHFTKKSSKPVVQPPVLDQLPDTAFLRLPQVLAVWPVSKSSWYRGVANGKYPAPVRICDNTAAWRVGDIRALLQAANNTQGAA